MATLNTAVQAMVDNLHNKMTSNEPLNGEEQTLMASAIDKLSGNTTWEQALIAVAEEHLFEATSNLSSTLTTATAALTNAETHIDTARQTMESQNTNLAQIPQIATDVQTSLDNFGATNSTEMRSNLAGMARPVFGIQHIEVPTNSSNNRRGQAAFAVYDANGESFVVRPAYGTSTSATESIRLEYLKLLADGSGKSVIANPYVHSSTFYTNPTSWVYRYGTSAILPLAVKDDASDIAYDVVYSTQDSATTSTSNYAGIYTRSASYTTVTKPKKNLDATDQWGISTVTNHNWHDVGALYDNNKHCLVMVDDSSSLLVEKYRDGNIVTTTSIANAAALQTYVDTGDFTVVKFIIHNLAHPSFNQKHHSGLASTNNSARYDMFGFFGKIGSLIKMGGQFYGAHYRFTEGKKLEPLNYHITSTSNHFTTAVPVTADINVAVTDIQGNTLGIYSFQSKTELINYDAGLIAGALVCINPYSHIGILNEFVNYPSTSAHYGIGRTCKAF